MSIVTSRSFRTDWMLFVAGPIIWFGHFMAVYVLAEAVCAAGGTGIEVLGADLLVTVTIAATVGATALTLAVGAIAWRRWRVLAEDRSDWLAGDQGNAGLCLGGALLAAVFAVSILAVGVPAAFLEPC